MAMVSNVLDGLRGASQLDGAIAAPAWLDHVLGPPAEEIVACTNGLLHLPTRHLAPHTPAFFSHNALAFAFERGAFEPRQWLEFLDQLWPEDREAIDTLQEVFGYCLTGDTRQQKAFLIVGPKRSGKGTIARVLARLVGADNAVAPTLAGLGTNFGIAPPDRQACRHYFGCASRGAGRSARDRRATAVDHRRGRDHDRSQIPAGMDRAPANPLPDPVE
jgi:putative DNA primase/helicase